MASVNNVTILGRLGKDPELKNTNSGKAVCSLSVATSRKFQDQQGNTNEKTEWHKVIVWGKTAENCAKYLAKGREVYLEGELQTRSYEKEGQKRFITEIVARNVQFIGGNPNTQQQQTQQPQQQQTQTQTQQPQQTQYQQPQQPQQQNYQQPPQQQQQAFQAGPSESNLDDIPF